MTGSEHGEGVRERGHGGEREKKTKTPLGGTPCRATGEEKKKY